MSVATLSAAVRVRVNGAERDFPSGAKVADLVAALAPEARLVAVERNAEIVPRTTWATTPLVDGDRFELVRFVQGG